jgi:hypothetical protein
LGCVLSTQNYVAGFVNRCLRPFRTTVMFPINNLTVAE